MESLLQQLAVEPNSEEVGAVVVGDIAVLDDEMKPISVASVGKCGSFGGKLMYEFTKVAEHLGLLNAILLDSFAQLPVNSHILTLFI